MRVFRRFGYDFFLSSFHERRIEEKKKIYVVFLKTLFSRTQMSQVIQAR